MSNHARNRSLKLVIVATALFVGALATYSPAEAGGSRGHRSFKFQKYQKTDRNCVPEIDPGAASSAIALALGGLALLRDRSRR